MVINQQEVFVYVNKVSFVSSAHRLSSVPLNTVKIPTLSVESLENAVCSKLTIKTNIMVPARLPLVDSSEGHSGGRLIRNDPLRLPQCGGQTARS